MSMAWREDALGFGVGFTLIGRGGPGFALAAVPGRGPGDERPEGPGLGATPVAFCVEAPWVGLGLGKP